MKKRTKKNQIMKRMLCEQRAKFLIISIHRYFCVDVFLVLLIHFSSFLFRHICPSRDDLCVCVCVLVAWMFSRRARGSKASSHRLTSLAYGTTHF